MRQDLLSSPATWDLLSTAGPTFLQRLVAHLCQLSGMALGFVSEIVDTRGERACPLAWCGSGGYRSGRCYETRATPCERLTESGTVIPDHLVDRFPTDVWLVGSGMRSLLALPLLAENGGQLGYFGVMAPAPVQDPDAVAELLRAFAPRCAAEVQRLRRDRALGAILGGSSWWLYRAFPDRLSTEISGPAGSGLLGFSAEEIREIPDLRRHQLYEEDRAHVLTAFAQAMQNGQGYAITYRLWDRERQRLHWFQDYAQVANGPDGQPDHLSGVLVELNGARGQAIPPESARQALTESEERLRMITRAARDAILMLDDLGRIVFWNDAATRIFGYAEEEAVGLDAHTLLTPGRLLRSARDGFRTFSRSGEGPVVGKTLRVDAVRKGGVEFPVELSVSALKMRDRWHTVGVIRDVSDREAALEQARESETRFRALFEDAADGLLIADPETGRFIDGNARMAAMLHCRREDLCGLEVGDIHPEEAMPRVRAEFSRLATEGRGEALNIPVVRRDGSQFTANVSSAPIRLDGHRYLVGAFRDLTERCAIEHELNRTRERLELIASTVPAVLFACALEEGLPIRFAGANLEEEFGIDPRHVVGRQGTWSEYAHSADSGRMAGALAVLRRTGSFSDEFRLRRPDGEWRWVHIELRLTRAQDRPVEVVGYLHDVTQRREAEDALREREASLAHAQAIANLGSWETDLGTGEEHWSDEVYRILGYAPRSFEPSHERLIERIHPDDRERLDRCLDEAIARGSACGLEFRVLRPDGGERFVRMRGEILQDDQGKGRTVVGTLLDFTDHRRNELSLERSRETLRKLAAHLQTVREEQRAEIAREIHDEMGQGLTAMKIDLVRLRSRLEGSESKVTDLLGSLLGSLDATMTAVQRIMAELRPSVLDDLGLAAAIEWLARQFTERTGIACDLDLPDAGPDLSQDARTALFRILQESLNNVARHAGATTVMVTLRHGDDSTRLLVEDDGKGISQQEVESPRSFGLLGMRERAAVFGGTLSIRSEAGIGTRVCVTIPMAALEEGRECTDS